MSDLSNLLNIYRQAPSEREKGTYFEELIFCCLRNEATYRDLYAEVWTYADYRVEKMRYGKIGKEKDVTTFHYSDKITITGIPPEAYDYVVNGKPVLDWVWSGKASRPIRIAAS